VDRYWDSDYKRWEGKKLNWWMPREAGKGGAEYTIYDVKGDPLQYFQTVTFP